MDVVAQEINFLTSAIAPIFPIGFFREFVDSIEFDLETNKIIVNGQYGVGGCYM